MFVKESVGTLLTLFYTAYNALNTVENTENALNTVANFQRNGGYYQNNVPFDVKSDEETANNVSNKLQTLPFLPNFSLVNMPPQNLAIAII